MSCATMPPALLLTQVLVRLQEARERVAHGWPSVAFALAGPPGFSAEARLADAAAAASARAGVQPWVLVLTDALALVEQARALWGSTPDAMPPLSSELAPCSQELRLHLAVARESAGKHLAWEDPGGLTRPQALCVLHLAVTLAKWEAQQQRSAAGAEQAHAELERARRESSLAAARRIWGSGQRPVPREGGGPRSLRDLAGVASAFSAWDEEDSP